MKMSCQSWSSVDVTYVQPPQVSVRNAPTPAMNLGSDELGRRVRMYHSPTSAKRGPRIEVNIASSDSWTRRTGCEGNEQHEDGALRVTVANSGRHGRKPFFWISLHSWLVCIEADATMDTDIEFILHDFVVMKPSANAQLCSRRGEARRWTYIPTKRAPTKAATKHQHVPIAYVVLAYNTPWQCAHTIPIYR